MKPNQAFKCRDTGELQWMKTSDMERTDHLTRSHMKDSLDTKADKNQPTNSTLTN